MVRLIAPALAVAVAVAFIQTAAAQAPDTDDAVETLPNFPGREDAFAYCSACHSFKVVARQGMDRTRWDETLSWMTEKQAMPAPEPDMRRIILDYLAQAYPIKAATPGGAFVNPFAPK